MLDIQSVPVAAALIACLTLPALSHATLDAAEAPPNASYRGSVRIAHGCQGSATTAVRLTIPEGVIGAKPMPKPGWTVSTVKGPYARSYEGRHGSVSAGVKEIVWSGGLLPDDQFDEFTFIATLSDAFAPGSRVAFPVVQECERGAHRWTDLPGPGEENSALKSPAPAVRIVQASSPLAAAAAAVRAGDLTLTQPWTRATPGGARVAGGYLRITNAGTAPDRLVGGSFPVAGRVEVHEMATVEGVMRMRPIEGGLVIRPGETVELKPGGLHVMFMDLSAGLKEGETVRGTLVFERAGSVEIAFQVGRVGTTRPPESAHQH